MEDTKFQKFFFFFNVYCPRGPRTPPFSFQSFHHLIVEFVTLDSLMLSSQCVHKKLTKKEISCSVELKGSSLYPHYL